MKNYKHSSPMSSKLQAHEHPNSNLHAISFFEEDVEVIDNYFERVEIPKFDDCKDAVIFHDFERVSTCVCNLVIVYFKDERLATCFLFAR